MVGSCTSNVLPVSVARRSVMHALPKSGVLFVLLTVTQALFTHCITINKLGPDIVAKTKVELSPLFINCYLNDVIRVSAPIINEQALYYLHKPNGDAMKLNITSPKLREMEHDIDVQPLEAMFLNNVKPIINLSNNYDVFRVTRELPWKDVFKLKKSLMEENDFMIGPLTVEDHGNWLLSVLTKDFNGDWVELFQVITVSIVENVGVTPGEPRLNIGDTFNISFIYPIPNLHSCELVVPRATFDRFYDRRRIDMNKCLFTVPNVTKSDMGVWRIIGVGKIVYIGEIFLTINMNSTTTVEPSASNSINSND